MGAQTGAESALGRAGTRPAPRQSRRAGERALRYAPEPPAPRPFVGHPAGPLRPREQGDWKCAKHLRQRQCVPLRCYARLHLFSCQDINPIRGRLLGKMQRASGPNTFSDWRLSCGSQLCNQPWDGDNRPCAVLISHKREDVPFSCARRWQLLVSALHEQLRVRPAKVEGAGNHKDFDAPVLPMVQEVMSEARLPALILFALEFGQQAHSLFKVHRPPVIRIDQAEVPKLGPLVKIRNARNRNLQQLLGEGIERAVVSNLLEEVEEIAEERVVFRRLGDAT